MDSVPILHLSYHLGNHYNSVRAITDSPSTDSPTTDSPSTSAGSDSPDTEVEMVV